jgi:hypothetical protein
MVSGFWILGITITANPIKHLTTIWDLRDVQYDIRELKDKEFSNLTTNEQYFRVRRALQNAQAAGEEEDARRLREILQTKFLDKKAHVREGLLNFAMTALLPPLMIFLVGISVRWVLQGWRITDQPQG